MPNITMFCPDPADATSWYRAVGPFAELNKTNKDLRISFIKEAHWATLAFTDIAFVQRPHRESDLEIIKRCKLQHIPVWVDLDDDLFSVPQWNPTHKHYSKESTQKVVAESVATADIVTVSTPALADKLRPLNANITVIPNALNTRLFPLNEPVEQNNIILWRGSATHKGDYEEIAQQLVELSLMPHMRPWAFIFVGDRPWFTHMMPEKNIIALDAMDVLDYHRFIKDIHPAIMIVPLADNDFNRSKSNCAWLEGSYAGACVVSPEMPEWDKPGITGTKPPFIADTLQRLIDNPALRKAKVEESRKYINDHLSLTETNKLRMEVVNQLMEGATT